MDANQENELLIPNPKEDVFAKIALWCGLGSVICLVVLPLIAAALTPVSSVIGMLAGAAVAVVPVASVIGMLVGVIGLIRIHRDPQRRTGTGPAWGGIAICAVIFVICGSMLAGLWNYVEWGQRNRTMRELVSTLNTYAHAHDGRYPVTLDELALQPDKLTSKRYSFYGMHSTQSFLFNGHLAGRRVDAVMHPERTVMIALGKENGTMLFHSLADIHPVNTYYAFVDGHTTWLSEQDIARRFPSDGTETDETWFIEPRFNE